MKSSIIASLKLFAVFMLLLLLGSIACGLIYMIYILCTTMISGQEVKIVSGLLFLKGIFVFAPLTIAASGAFLCFFLVRHKKESKLNFIVYTVFYMVMWIFLMPACISVEKKIERMASMETENKIVSAGYFRHGENDSVYYYTRIDENNLGEGIRIQNKKIAAFSSQEVTPSKDEFADSIVKEHMEMDIFQQFLVNSYRKMFAISAQSVQSGFLSWLSFASLGVLLLSFYGMRKLSIWRLINVVLVALLYIGAFNLNLYIYDGTILSGLSNFFTKHLSFLPGNPLVVIMNVTLAIIFFVLGSFINYQRNNSVSGFISEGSE